MLLTCLVFEKGRKQSKSLTKKKNMMVCNNLGSLNFCEIIFGRKEIIWLSNEPCLSLIQTADYAREKKYRNRIRLIIIKSSIFIRQHLNIVAS